jgi:hypothetical protein
MEQRTRFGREGRGFYIYFQPIPRSPPPTLLKELLNQLDNLFNTRRETHTSYPSIDLTLCTRSGHRGRGKRHRGAFGETVNWWLVSSSTSALRHNHKDHQFGSSQTLFPRCKSRILHPFAQTLKLVSLAVEVVRAWCGCSRDSYTRGIL